MLRRNPDALRTAQVVGRNRRRSGTDSAQRSDFLDLADDDAVIHQIAIVPQRVRDAAAVNPNLRERLGTESDPAEFAYNEGKRLLAIASAGSLEAYIEAEVAKRSQAQAPAPQPTIPETLATAPASRAPAGLPFAPPSLDDILSGR